MTRCLWSTLSRGMGRGYARLPDGVDRAVLGTWTRLRRAMRRHVTVDRVSGEDLTVLIADRSSAIDYLLQKWLDDPQFDLVGRRRRGTDLVASEHGADLTIARVDRRAAAGSRDATTWRVPEAVGAVVHLTGCDTDPTWDNKSNKNNLRRIKRNNLVCEISHDPAEFDSFYRELYRPYTAQRYGELAASRSYHRMLREFHRGGLIRVTQNGERLAASVFSVRGQRVRSWILAPDPRRPDAVTLGSLTATYLHLMQWALGRKLQDVDLGASRPVLNDGVLVHKKYWGAQVMEERGIEYDLALQWSQWSPALARCLHETPLVVRDGDGLAGLTAMPMDQAPDPGQTRSHLERLAMPGLTRLIVIADAGWHLPDAHLRGHSLTWLTGDEVSVRRPAP